MTACGTRFSARCDAFWFSSGERLAGRPSRIATSPWFNARSLNITRFSSVRSADFSTQALARWLRWSLKQRSSFAVKNTTGMVAQPLDLFNRVQPPSVRHTDVQDDGVRMLAPADPDRLLTVACEDNSDIPRPLVPVGGILRMPLWSSAKSIVFIALLLVTLFSQDASRLGFVPSFVRGFIASSESSGSVETAHLPTKQGSPSGISPEDGKQMVAIVAPKQAVGCRDATFAVA